MPVYLIADVKVTDDAWIPDYAAKVHDIVQNVKGVDDRLCRRTRDC